MIVHSRLGVRLSIFLLRALHLSPNNIFSDVVVLAQVEESPDLRCPLRTKTLGENVISQAWDITLALFDNDKRKNGNIGTDNAATDRFALALARTTGTVTRVTVGEEKANTVRQENALLHRKALLVVATGNAENITLPLVTNRVGRDLLRDLLVIEDTAVKGALEHVESPHPASFHTIVSHRRGRWSFEPPWRGLGSGVRGELGTVMDLGLTSDVKLHDESDRREQRSSEIKKRQLYVGVADLEEKRLCLAPSTAAATSRLFLVGGRGRAPAQIWKYLQIRVLIFSSENESSLGISASKLPVSVFSNHRRSRCAHLKKPLSRPLPENTLLVSFELLILPTPTNLPHRIHHGSYARSRQGHLWVAYLDYEVQEI
jgi:hypothetical protein